MPSSSESRAAFAVVRVDDFFDEPLSAQNVADRLTITKVVLTLEEAEAEAVRLTELAQRRRAGVSYFAQTTRLRVNEPTEPTLEQLERGVAALLPFADEWELSLNPENLQELAYVVLRYGVDAAATEADYVEIDQAVRRQLAEWPRGN